MDLYVAFRGRQPTPEALLRFLVDAGFTLGKATAAPYPMAPERILKQALARDPVKGGLDLYGTRGGDGSYATNCLMARRLAERGVRFIQLYHRGWDHHGGIKRGFTIAAKEVDQATTALVLDLKQRGLLEDTLVLWTGEFGRTAMNEERNGSTFLGRDHHPHAFSLWMAGGGLRPGLTFGATDDFGYRITEDPVHVHDLQATLLHLLGIDHERLTHRYQGRDFRLTDVHGRVVQGLLA